MAIFFWCAILSLLARPLAAEVFTFDSAEKWQTWQLPQGLVQLGPSGHLELVKFRKDIDPVRNASDFFHDTMERKAVQGGIFRAGSNSRDAFKIIDGDANTFWQPDPADPLAKWEVEIDLGRAVLAEELRLRFPDQEGARPMRQFTVYVATGATIDPRKDVFRFESVYQTTLPNEETEIRIGLSGRNDITRVLDPGLDVVLEDAARFRVIQYIRIGADEQSADAALAEVEVSAVGDNFSLGVLERGGSFETGLVVRDVVGLVDGDMNTYANKFTTYRATSGWRNEGLWWELDLGGQFWIDEIFLYFNNQGEGASGSSVRNGGTGFAFLVSDGRRTTSGEVDYDRLVGHGNEQAPFAGPERHYRYLFEPRKVRYLFWHGFLTSHEWHARAAELMLFSPGYPAQVVLRSGFIDLGKIVGDGRAKAIKHLSWDADLPVGTRMQLRSRSGVRLSEEYTYHNKIGEVVLEEKWLSLPKVLRGQVDTALVVGEDWGEWSNVYQLSGEAFQSDSPRRFIQLEALLSTEDPQVAPVLRSLSIEFEDALVTEAKGQVWPREARPNEDTRFTYTLWPTTGRGRQRLRPAAAHRPRRLAGDGSGGSNPCRRDHRPRGGRAARRFPIRGLGPARWRRFAGSPFHCASVAQCHGFQRGAWPWRPAGSVAIRGGRCPTRQRGASAGFDWQRPTHRRSSTGPGYLYAQRRRDQRPTAYPLRGLQGGDGDPTGAGIRLGGPRGGRVGRSG